MAGGAIASDSRAQVRARTRRDHVMKVAVDRKRCIASGMCTSIAPELFELDDGILVLRRGGMIDDSDLDAVSDAVACCPVEALRLCE